MSTPRAALLREGIKSLHAVKRVEPDGTESVAGYVAPTLDRAKDIAEKWQIADRAGCIYRTLPIDEDKADAIDPNWRDHVIPHWKWLDTLQSEYGTINATDERRDHGHH